MGAVLGKMKGEGGGAGCVHKELGGRWGCGFPRVTCTQTAKSWPARIG